MVKIGDVALGEFPFLLAPMEDVSDPPFRALCKEQGCDMMYTEFISVEGLIRDAKKSVVKLDIYPEERPIGVQIFGAELDSMMRAAEIVEEAQPEVLDINFGCPVKKVVCKMAGAGILQDVDRMVELTAAVVKSTKLPVTVKTRLGWDQNSIKIEEVAKRLQDVGIKALSIHGRTRAQMYKGEADWSHIAKVKENPSIHIPIFGNGDIDSPEKALAVIRYTGADAVMIGRAAQGRPWIFRQIAHYLQTGELLPDPSETEIAKWLTDHLHDHYRFYGEVSGVRIARKHIGWYLKGLPGAKIFRDALNRLESTEDQLRAIEQFFAQRHDARHQFAH